MAVQFNREVFEKLWFTPSVTIARIAETMGVTHQAVSWRAKSFGLPSRTPMRPRRTNKALFCEMWLAGVSSKEIAAHFSLASHTSAVSMARKFNMPKRQRGASGKRNGGWLPTITVAEFFEIKAGQRLAESAAETNAVMALCEMSTPRQAAAWRRAQ